MPVYQGGPVRSGSVTLVAPQPEKVAAALDIAGISESEKMWFERAQDDDTLLYFSVEAAERLVGQIILHDVDRAAREALVAYHVFRPEDRGQGHGSAALRGLCAYASGELGLRRLVAITALDNAASRRIASKAGFREIGPAREGPHLIGYEWLAAEA